jgi:hypothetical protein
MTATTPPNPITCAYIPCENPTLIGTPWCFEHRVEANPPDELDLDDIILDLVHRGSLFPRGKTINAGMFPEAKAALQPYVEREKLDSYIRGISYAANDAMRHDSVLHLNRMEGEIARLMERQKAELQAALNKEGHDVPPIS